MKEIEKFFCTHLNQKKNPMQKSKTTTLSKNYSNKP